MALQLIAILLNDRTAQRACTSAITREDWMNDLLTGEPLHIQAQLGINWGTFIFLVKAMQELNLQPLHVTIKEQVGIFLYTTVTGLPCIHVAEHF